MAGAARIALLLLLGLAACPGEERADPVPETDRLYFPVGVAVAPASGLPGGTALIVASSNFDLRYSPRDGGTLLSVDPEASPDHGALATVGVQRIGSYAGPVAAIDRSACGGAGEEAFVASRFDDVLYRFGLSSDGALTCGAGCQVRFGAALRDPFAVATACRSAGPRAFVGFLNTPASTTGYGAAAWLAELDLSVQGGAPREVEIGDGPVRSIAWDSAADRLWVASRSSGARAILYAVQLADPAWGGASPRDAVEAYDLFSQVRGAELRSVAIGSQPATPDRPQRLYVTARLYDAEYQDSTGNRPAGDVGGVLIVLDVVDGPAGLPVVTVHKVLDLGAGAGDVAVVSRGTQRDVVVATAGDESLVFVYDDEWEAVAAVFGRDPATGAPAFARTPVALAVDQPGADATARVYVAAFGDHDVATFSLSPARPWAPFDLKRVGGLAP